MFSINIYDLYSFVRNYDIKDYRKLRFALFKILARIQSKA